MKVALIGCSGWIAHYLTPALDKRVPAQSTFESACHVQGLTPHDFFSVQYFPNETTAVGFGHLLGNHQKHIPSGALVGSCDRNWGVWILNIVSCGSVDDDR